MTASHPRENAFPPWLLPFFEGFNPNSKTEGSNRSQVSGVKESVDAFAGRKQGRDPDQESHGAPQEVVPRVRGERGELGRLFRLAQALWVVTVLVIINALQPDKFHDNRADWTLI